MKRCLSDEVLLSLRYGDTSLERVAHLRECSSCTGRYRQLVEDLAVIDRALGDASLSGVPSRQSTRRRLWLPLAAAAAGAALTLIAQIGPWHIAGPRVNPETRAGDADVVRFLDDVSSVLLGGDQREDPLSQLTADLGETLPLASRGDWLGDRD